MDTRERETGFQRGSSWTGLETLRGIGPHGRLSRPTFSNDFSHPYSDQRREIRRYTLQSLFTGTIATDERSWSEYD